MGLKVPPVVGVTLEASRAVRRNGGAGLTFMSCRSFTLAARAGDRKNSQQNKAAPCAVALRRCLVCRCFRSWGFAGVTGVRLNW